MLTCVTMSELDAIRPYCDEEIPAVVARLQEDPALLRALAAVRLPWLAKRSPRLAALVAGIGIRRRLAHVRSIADIQTQVARLLSRLERETMSGFSVSGIGGLEPGVPYLFIANHRDIVLDSALLNWALHKAGHATSFTAVGDNLVATPWVGDVMRLNKSFVVARSITSPKAAFKAYSVTSAFIRQSLESGNSVWIAQRQGRAKDGNDHTDPAILKMLTIAYRRENESLRNWLTQVRLLPVTVTYELDPCDLMKAHELYIRSCTGTYTKSRDEDLQSIAMGLTGYKGRVHLHFGERIVGVHDDVECLAKAVDTALARGARLFPVHRQAAAELGDSVDMSILLPEPIPQVDAALAVRLQSCPPQERTWLWLQYANIWRNTVGAQHDSVCEQHSSVAALKVEEHQTISGGSSSAASCSLSSST